jgi:integrase
VAGCSDCGKLGAPPLTRRFAAPAAGRLDRLSTFCQRSTPGPWQEGYIRQRGNAWQVIVHAGHDPITGKRRNLTGTARTKREAQALRARLLNQVNEGKRPAADVTVAQLLARWLEIADLAWSTRVTYQGYINRTILPALGDLPLRRLDTRPSTASPPHCAPAAALAASRWRRPACARSTRSCGERSARRPLGWIPANPAALASPPRPGPTDIRPPAPEELSLLLETVSEADPDFAVLLWLAATTGARRRELCALR